MGTVIGLSVAVTRTHWLCAIVLLMAGTQASAQSMGRITFTGKVVEPTQPADTYQAARAANASAPHRVTQQAFDAMATKGEFLEYFARRYREAGVSSDRLRLVSVDYF